MNLLTDSVGDVINTSGSECATNEDDYDRSDPKLGQRTHLLVVLAAAAREPLIDLYPRRTLRRIDPSAAFRISYKSWPCSTSLSLVLAEKSLENAFAHIGGFTLLYS